MRAWLRLTALAGSAGVAGVAPPAPNVLIVLVDDWGIDMHAAWGFPDASRPPTPTIDALIERGVRFENAWTMPVCSPTRATLLTGRYPWRTGLGWVVLRGDEGLPADETTLPELLARAAAEDLCPRYATAAFGKWHLGRDPRHPLESGFDHFAGTRGNLNAPETYCRWLENTNGDVALCERYATSETVDDALAWIDGRQEPWLAYVAFHAGHWPWHLPPRELAPWDEPPPPAPGCPPHDDLGPCEEVCDVSWNATAGTGRRFAYEAMIRALDVELGRLLAGIDLATTTVLLLGDNGTPAGVVLPPLAATADLPVRAKASVYRGGVAVPLVVAGASVAGPARTSAALVSVADLFATVAVLCGVPSTELERLAGHELDALDFGGVLRADSAGPRSRLFAEQYDRVHPEPRRPFYVDRTISDGRFKLLRFSSRARAGQHAFEHMLFDLHADPYETVDLMPTLDAEQRAAFERLAGELDAIPLLPADARRATEPR